MNDVYQSSNTANVGWVKQNKNPGCLQGWKIEKIQRENLHKFYEEALNFEFLNSL